VCQHQSFTFPGQFKGHIDPKHILRDAVPNTSLWYQISVDIKAGNPYADPQSNQKPSVTITHTCRETMVQDRKSSRKGIIDELIRKDIMESAINVLMKKGFKQFTMDQVASTAGIAKGTLYLHFQGKKQLLDSVVDFCSEPLGKEYESVVNSDADPVFKLERLALETLMYAENHKALLYEVRSVMFNFNTHEQVMEDHNSWYWNTVNLISAVLDEAVKSGRFRSFNPRKMANLFFESINALMTHRVLTDVEETIEEDTQEMMELYIKGLSLQ